MTGHPDPDRVADFVLKEDLVSTMQRRGLVVHRRPWQRPTRPRPGHHVPLDERIAADPAGTLHHLAQLVASELRSTGHAIPIPVHRQTLRDRYTATGPAGVIFTAVLAAALVVAAIALFVWSRT